MNSSRMRTAPSLPYRGVSMTETPPDRDPPGQRPQDRDPQTETPRQRPLRLRPPGQRLPRQRPPWIETPWDRDRDPPCGQTDTGENLRKLRLRVVIK